DSSGAEDITHSLPAAIGEPDLRFGLWITGRGWVTPDGQPLDTPAPESDEVMRTIDRQGKPFAALVHRTQLEESPEVIQAIVAAAALIFENEALDAELRSAVRDLRNSRARVIEAGDLERRRIERDLHDGAQQRLISLSFKMQSASEAAGKGTPIQKR